MCTVKTQKHYFPFIIISTTVPNDTRIHVILKVPCTISFNCCTLKFQQYCTKMNKEKEQVTIFDNYAKSVLEYNFKLLTEIKTNYEPIEAEAAKKLRTMSLCKTYWFLYKKKRVINKLYLFKLKC